MIDITQQNPRSPILSQWIFPSESQRATGPPGRDVGLHGVGRGRSPFWIGTNWSRGRECGMGKLGIWSWCFLFFPVNFKKNVRDGKITDSFLVVTMGICWWDGGFFEVMMMRKSPPGQIDQVTKVSHGKKPTIFSLVTNWPKMDGKHLFCLAGKWVGSVQSMVDWLLAL